MATRKRVSCITKASSSSDRHITHIGGVDAGARWRKTEEKAIEEIENGTYEYYVHVKDETVKIIVAKRNGVPYLKTENDGETPDNLLSLDECP